MYNNKYVPQTYKNKKVIVLLVSACTLLKDLENSNMYEIKVNLVVSWFFFAAEIKILKAISILRLGSLGLTLIVDFFITQSCVETVNSFLGEMG